MKGYGGKTVYGARVGILMLDTKWPRPPGDTGNAMTWPFPVLYKAQVGWAELAKPNIATLAFQHYQRFAQYRCVGLHFIQPNLRNIKNNHLSLQHEE